jgi:hypothetical protein
VKLSAENPENTLNLNNLISKRICASRWYSRLGDNVDAGIPAPFDG